MSRNTDTSFAVEALGALAQETRLAVFRRLMSAYPDAVASGEVASACGVLHNTMSNHLAVLNRAGLVASERRGRSVLYRADVEGFRRLFAFLASDCCQGRTEICAPVMASLLARCPPQPPAAAATRETSDAV